MLKRWVGVGSSIALIGLTGLKAVHKLRSIEKESLSEESLGEEVGRSFE